MIIGKNIKKLREGLGLTQEQLADKLCLSAQAVSKWETGQSVPDTMLLPSLSKVLGIGIDDLFKEHMEEYENLASKLAAIYEDTELKEDFLQADLAYDRLFAQGNYTAKDVYLYGNIYQGYVENCYRIAEGSYKKVMEMIGDESDMTYDLAMNRLIEIKHSRNQLQPFIAELKVKFEANPDNKFIRQSLISAYRQADQDDIAEKLVDEAIASGAEEWGLYQAKGSFHLYNRNEIHEAIACYKKAWSIDSNTYCNTLYTLYCAYKRLGDKENTLDILNQWLKWYDDRGASVSKRHVYRKIEDLLNES